MTVGNLALLAYFPHPDDSQIPSSSSSTANSIIATSTLVSNPTSTIDSTLTKTVVNCSIISSVRPWFEQQSHNPHSYMSADSDGPVKLELPEQWLWDIIDEFIYQYQVFCSWRSKVKNKTEDELVMLGEGGPVCLVLSFSSVSASQGRTTLDLEFLQRPQCSLFPGAKIQDQRVHHRPERGKNTGRNRVRWYLVPTSVHSSSFCLGKSSESMVNAHFTECWVISVSLVFSGCMFSLATSHSHSRSWRT